MAIKLEYVPVASYTKNKDCPHNNALECGVKNCKRCGWNPEVAKKRMDKILWKRK
jgi:hypothetical protein